MSLGQMMNSCSGATNLPVFVVNLQRGLRSDPAVAQVVAKTLSIPICLHHWLFRYRDTGVWGCALHSNHRHGDAAKVADEHSSWPATDGAARHDGFRRHVCLLHCRWGAALLRAAAGRGEDAISLLTATIVAVALAETAVTA